jgi:hypothetical protein
MPMPSATDAAARWAQQFGASGARWAAGVQAVQVAPGQLAARAKNLWAQNTAAAIDRFAANSAKVTREQWIETTVTKGQPRLASGAQAALPKVEAAFGKLFPFIQNTVNALPPRGDIEANINRAAQFARQMHTYKTGS